MENEKQQSINLSIIVKILYKNIFLIMGITILSAALGGFYAFTNKSFKSEIILYGNDRILNEIGETSQYSLNSFDFLLFIKNNSKTLKNKNLSDEKFLKEMSSRLTAQSESNNPTIKVKFSTKDKSEGENFSQEYVVLASRYLRNKKETFLNNQIKLLEEQYNFLTQNVDIRTTKDSLSDSLVSRLAYYRLLKNDINPVVKLISLHTKPALSKKIILIGALFLGLFLGIFIAFVKEFSKTLDWKEIKSK
ncbi:lipopolysaccharide biosynthesis protein [Leptotrichia sp. OH3620_COT-345]|uniref:lipopolysaccharide biosynthesis protein n=1 Tax=Leptotrichia sp. OH3620_COT-345 TaxID=2491048 RepID=UPI000F648C1C|nr:lipopolysaccharide biosynthesis protein [Leptotrichia sp. OH3620_COT-345]RRD40889.1 lipopolysaccharide biosynthesis protein [Leptotrichia sp. OH3620_COT-345]